MRAIYKATRAKRLQIDTFGMETKHWREWQNHRKWLQMTRSPERTEFYVYLCIHCFASFKVTHNIPPLNWIQHYKIVNIFTM